MSGLTIGEAATLAAIISGIEPETAGPFLVIMIDENDKIVVTSDIECDVNRRRHPCLTSSKPLLTRRLR